jgi:hypothetical protein
VQRLADVVLELRHVVATVVKLKASRGRIDAVRIFGEVDARELDRDIYVAVSPHVGVVLERALGVDVDGQALQDGMAADRLADRALGVVALLVLVVERGLGPARQRRLGDRGHSCPTIGSRPDTTPQASGRGVGAR